MLTRKIGSLLRGNATPAQLMLACILGAMLGFMPSFASAAGLIVVLTLAVVVLNANLLVAATVGLLAKAISLMLMPVSFAVGRVLLDGPTQPLFKSAINTPVLALFGFEYYATTGGLVMGLIVGVVCGLVLVKIIQGFRTKMAAVAEGSEAYQKWAGKGSVKALTWLFFGGGPKGGYAEALKRKGGVIRPIGVVFAVLVVGLLFIVQMFFAGPIVTALAQRGLEDANGATVDLASAEVDLGEGRMVLHGLAMADPNALDTDLVRAERVEIDISSADLLRKRAKLDRVVLVDAQNGVKRDVPGHLIRGRPEDVPPQDAPADGEKTIDDYIKDAQLWKDRLAQVRRWLESVSGSEEPSAETAEGETFEERLRRRIGELGYARVSADHLIAGAPTLTIAELIAQKVKTQHLPGETLDVVAHNLSTHPHLLDAAPSIDVHSSADTLKLALNLVGISAAGGQSTIDFAARNLPVDAIASALAGTGTSGAPMTGGSLDALLSGNWSIAQGGELDLPLQVNLRDTTLNLGGRSQKVSQFGLALGLSGPMDNPHIKLDEKQLADALVKAGAGELANEAKAKADAEIQKATGKLTEKLGDKAPVQLEGVTNQAGEALKGLFGGKK